MKRTSIREFCIAAFVGTFLMLRCDVLGAKILQPVDVFGAASSSGFSYYGTSPESPDGTRVTYVVYHGDGSQELRLCNRDLTCHRKLADVKIGIHNGAKAFWIDNQRLAYVSDGLRVIDVDSGQLLYGPFPIRCETHYSVQHTIVIYGQVGDEWAIWELDCNSGGIRKVTTLDALSADPSRLGVEELDEFTQIQPSADGTRVLFRYGPQDGKRMACLHMNGAQSLIAFPGNKPMHFLRYDNETVMGVNWGFSAGDHNPNDRNEFQQAAKNRWFQRYEVDGGVIETLAGPITHGAASPDRMWYAGETANYGESPIRLALYAKGHTEPAAILMEHEFAKMTWRKRAHVNPAFSRDGRRVYFFRAASDDRFKASFVGISRFVDEIQDTTD